ncbi:MAG: hypothetical protein HPY53_06510 [Brevinematales bacterium]|nr:hypothetical protein [Brevinematales bacterium]
MSFRFLFTLGLLLSLVTFSLNVGSYVFYYSVLGYGLMLISFLMKKLTFIDGIWLFLIGGTFASVLLDQNEWSLIFLMLFCMFYSVFYLVGTEKLWIRILSIVALAAVIASLGGMITMIAGIPVFLPLIDPFIIATVLLQGVFTVFDTPKNEISVRNI